ncbi:hypothetical protein Y032_0487g2349 [Ancylostoma ceylanicum]|uniref:DNA mismatch repair proteins mutS family domain-containing protein n=1 Tax=Ancylostoma ceylanicum TaxID=53326 RepID=A0A016WWK3_9BILA|nr:hypothetical protein Y032_0487g2349 [Ancylostoma ceylanicum]
MAEEQSVVPSSQSAADAVIASISLSGSYLGVAIYDQSRTAIRLLNDVLEDQEFSTLDSLLQQEEPAMILVNKSQDIRFIRYISQHCGATISNDDVDVENSTDAVGSSFTSSTNSLPPSAEVSTSVGEPAATVPAGSPNKDTGADDGDGASDDEEDSESSPPTLVFLANNAYNFESGFKRISELFAEECSNEAENHLSTRFRIDISSRNMVRALGALLKYMDSARIGVEYEAANVRTPITTIKTIRIGEMVEIDKDTYRALDIFSDDKGKQRPFSNASESSGAKSLFALCNRCRSAPGKYMLRKWFGSPTADREVLVKRQKAISFFLQDCNLELTGKLHTLLGSLRSVRHILNRLRAGTAKVAHWENLYKTISSSVMIGRYLESLSSPLALLKDDIDCYSETLVETYAVLNAMIDFEESYAENRLVMRPGVDPELDRAKGLYRQLPSILTRVAQEEASRFQAATCSVAYVPMIGYLVALPHDFQVENFEDVEVIYSTAHTLHAKDEAMRKLDEDLGDVKMRIIDKETTITLRMSSLILSRSSLLLAAERAGALLDVVISLSLTARHYGWTCPKFVDEPIIDATRVYHPLSQLITEHFVPNPVSSGVEYSKIKIFTGPNACGKSVYLKQVGLLVFLAHIGSFVPADFARIGTVNRILSRIYTVDSVLDGMSTFAKDLDQISFALRRGNERSLVIIDEFGKGTMTEVGLSLLASSLSYWAAKGRDGCPHVFVSSHFHALQELITDVHGIISYHTMEVLKRGAELTFQFRLVDGLVDSSFAVYTACKMGIPQEVVDRANEVYEHVRGGNALTELSCVDSDEERKNRWLARRMQGILPDFEDFDVDHGLDGLLDLIGESLLEPDERIGQTSSQESNATPEKNDEEEAEDEEEGPEERNSSLPPLERSASEDERYTSLQELDESRSSLPSALRTKGKKVDRSNLSVSFAIDMDEVRTEIATTTTTSDSEAMERVKHIVIADSDDESQSVRSIDETSATVNPLIQKMKKNLLKDRRRPFRRHNLLNPLLSVHHLLHRPPRRFLVNARALYGFTESEDVEMETSSSDSVLRRTGIICSKTGEKLGTIEEELTHWIQDHRKSTTKCIKESGVPKKSATFHNIVDLQKTRAPRPHQSNSDQQIKNLAPPRRKRSLFYEMGERIRLFSAGSFVTTVPPSPHHVSKTQSLNSFCETASNANVASPSRRPMKKSRSRVGQGSVVSLQNNDAEVVLLLTVERWCCVLFRGHGYGGAVCNVSENGVAHGIPT